jgi:hypothetical protein
MIAAVSGLVLIISPFLEWYNVSAKSSLVDFSVGGSGWDILSWVPWLITLIGLVAIGLAVAKAAGALPNLPSSPGFIILVLGGAAVVFTLFRLLVVPDAGVSSSVVDVGRSFGIFIAFLAAVGVAVGGWLTWNEEGKPKPGSARGGAAAGPGAGGALGGGQPYGGAPTGQPYAGGAPTAAQPAATPAASPAAAPAQAEAPAAGGAAKADWYPDPRGEKRLRYWDGSQWTDHTAD